MLEQAKHRVAQLSAKVKQRMGAMMGGRDQPEQGKAGQAKARVKQTGDRLTSTAQQMRERLPR